MKNKVAQIKNNRIFELAIELTDVEPRVWRKILVEDSISMYQLHEIIQVVMGWMHSHLFMFKMPGIAIELPSPDDDDWENIISKDARKIKVSSIFQSTNDAIIYEYDFGDSWEHEIKLERIVDLTEVKFGVPRCIDGANACPPEDCGGAPGFEYLKEVLADPNHEEYEFRIHWLDHYYPNYDPKEFSLSAVNKLLKIGASKFLKIAPKLYG